MRTLNEMIVHCTATRPDWLAGHPTSAKVSEVRRWHVKDRGWSDIGYHYLIDRDGTVATGRPVSRVGAHVSGHNENTIGVALFGGYESNERDTFGTHYTPEQEGALRNLIRKLMRDYPSITTVSGHNQYAAKACPGFHVPTWFHLEEPAPRLPPDVEPLDPPQPGIRAAILAFLRKYGMI